MINQPDLDRAIDAAAGAMMVREPGRSLRHTVMARVREDEAPTPRRFVWVTATVSLVVCSAIAMTLISQTAATVPPLPRSAQLTVGQPPTMPSATVTLLTEAAPPLRAGRIVGSGRTVATRAPLPLRDVSPIEPIPTDPIVLSSIDVPQLEPETASIDALNVEPLTIEPLATSND